MKNTIIISAVIGIIIVIFYFNNDVAKPTSNTPKVLDFQAELSPKLSNVITQEQKLNDDWFTKEILYLFDGFIDSGDGDLVAIYKTFNAYCKPLVYCADLSELFDRYIDYKKSFSEFNIYDDRENIALIYQAREDLKDKYFSEYEQSILFGLETEWDLQMLARRSILTDPNLSESQKKEAIDQHLDNLSEDQKLDFKNTLNLSKVMEFHDHNKLVEENFNELAAEFSPEVAQRLIDDYKEQNEWTSRVETYQNYKKGVEILNPNDKELVETLLTTFLNENFTTREIKRVNVLVQ